MLEELPVARDPVRVTREPQEVPEQGLVGSQNRTAELRLQRLNGPDGAKAVPTYEDALDVGRRLLAHPFM